jgi:hypothetical protein
MSMVWLSIMHQMGMNEGTDDARLDNLPDIIDALRSVANV